MRNHQTRNSSTGKFAPNEKYSFEGDLLSIKEISKKSNVSYQRIYKRLQRGLSVTKALNDPLVTHNGNKNPTQNCKWCGKQFMQKQKSQKTCSKSCALSFRAPRFDFRGDMLTIAQIAKRVKAKPSAIEQRIRRYKKQHGVDNLESHEVELIAISTGLQFAIKKKFKETSKQAKKVCVFCKNEYTPPRPSHTQKTKARRFCSRSCGAKYGLEIRWRHHDALVDRNKHHIGNAGAFT